MKRTRGAGATLVLTQFAEDFQVAGAFQTGRFWFLFDNDVNLTWDDGPGIDEDFDQRLIDSGRLPDLAGAPVVSWVIARLAWLVGWLPMWACNQYEEGGRCYFSFCVFDRNRLRIGSAEVVGDEEGVAVCCECSDAVRVLEELAAVLLAYPTDVAECRVEVREAEDEAECELQGIDPDTRVQAVYGYEQGRYLGSHWSSQSRQET